MNRPFRHWHLLVIWALLLTVPVWLPMLGGYTALAGRVVIFALAAMSFNILLGFTGVMSFGHAAYFGLGAYGCGLFLKFVAASTPLAILSGTLLGGIAGTLFGLLLVRRRGVYFAMVTIAFGQVCFYVAYKWDDFTGGYDGLRGFSRAPLDFGLFLLDITNSTNMFYYFVIAVFALAVGAQALILRSPFGRTLLAIRENERRARFLGIPVERHIWLSFSISCFFTALAGSLYALLNNFADPMGLNYIMSGNIVMITVMGGMRMFWGPLLGAMLFVMLQDYVSSMTTNWMFFVGLTFVAVVLFFPRGLMGILQKEGRRMSTAPKLEVRGVTKNFGSLTAVSAVSMRVEHGELRAIIGPNGAGKTTFFNLITGFFPPTSGEILLDGRDISKVPAARRVKLGMGRTFQITEIFPELTVRENARIAVETGLGFSLRGWLGGTDEKRVRDACDEVMTLANLTAKADRLVGELSHGDQRSAEIAMALALKPSLLLLDEPTAGMGDEETYQVTGLIRRLHRDSKYTIVLIEHDMRVVFHLADHISVLTEGKLLAEGTPAEIAANVHVQNAYLGKSGMNAIEVSGLNTYYGKSHILHDVSMVVEEGSVTTLLGRNGAGKTTTMRSIMGLTPARSGTISVFGRDSTRLPPFRVAGLSVGYVPEGRRVFPNLTVEDNLKVPQGKSGPYTIPRIYELFPRLQERRMNLGRQLSGGEQEMLSIARALLLNPKVLILDEPSQGLAPLIVKDVFRIVSSMRQEGMTVLLVEQNIRMSLEIADTAYVLDHGVVVHHGSAAALAKDEALIQSLAGASSEEWDLEKAHPAA